MAIALTNIGTNSSKAGPATLSASVPAGGVPAGCVIFLLVAGTIIGATTDVTASDSASNSYSASVAVSASTDWYVGIFIAWSSVAALTSGQSVTANFSVGTSSVCVSAFYATGLQTSADPTDATGTSTATTSVTTTGNVSQTGELIIGAGNASGGSGNSFTQDGTNQGGFTGGGLNTGAAPQRTGTTGAGANTNTDLFAGAVVGWSSSGTTAKYQPTDGGTVRAMAIATFKTAPPTAPAHHQRLQRALWPGAYLWSVMLGLACVAGLLLRGRHV